MRVGISGTHGTGKTTLAEGLCERLPRHVMAEEPYYLLEEEGYDFGFPPSLEDYRALLECSVRSLASPEDGIVFDRTPVDYLAYMAAIGADPVNGVGGEALRTALMSLDLLVITVITPETERTLPPPEMPALRSRMNEALLDLISADPFDVWADLPILELDGPLGTRPATVLAALEQLR
ncbi:AAA domain-containing protein [Actinocorallia herbida]|uniref:AAA domain-containing protein n=1 Tax=Actinocorallia herbida TaxID=58109 RepID=A0A3N1D0C7_9ACTN|nr:AAA family ATPase [Actinocorallia herbida]ROO86979.1 AAA domain-containing protein [Actinocorallia herbida]